MSKVMPDFARSFLAAVVSVGGFAQARAVARERLLGLRPEGAAWLLDHVVGRGYAGDVKERRALPATMAALLDVHHGEGGAAWVAAVRAAATRERLRLAALLLESAAPRTPLARGGRLDEGRFELADVVAFLSPRPRIHRRAPETPHAELVVAREAFAGFDWDAEESVLTDAEPCLDFNDPATARRFGTLAATVSRQAVSSGLLHRDVDVVRTTLTRFITRDAQLFRIAARTPLPGPLCVALVERAHALAHPRLREALVNNPSVPAAVALALLPTVSRRTVRTLAVGRDHAVTRLALALLGQTARAAPPPGRRRPADTIRGVDVRQRAEQLDPPAPPPSSRNDDALRAVS